MDATPRAGTPRKLTLILSAITAVVVTALLALTFVKYGHVVGRVAGRMAPRVYEDLVVFTFASPWFYVFTAGILLLEWRFPADTRQKVFSVGLAQDFVWLILESLLRVTILVTYAAVLRSLYRRYCGGLTIDTAAHLAPWVRFAVAVLVIDFIGFFHHWLRHKVKPLWWFHTVHHSQTELNLFTDLRYHVVEYVVGNTVRFFPLMLLNIGNPGVLAYAVAHQWYTRFYHANIRTNLGPLRFVLVTPQSHRVHHSVHRRHWDKNFGVIFSFWDRLLGTHYRNDREYPRTGIPDRDFPMERRAKVWELVSTPMAQLVFPFTRFRRGASLNEETSTPNAGG